MYSLIIFMLTQNTDKPKGLLEIVSEWGEQLMNFFGAPGLALAIGLELPSEAVLPLAGFTASKPNAAFSYWEALIWATLGALGGAIALYWLGRALGKERFIKYLAKLPLVSTKDAEKSILFFQKHGGKAVFFGRMLPVFRAWISVPAGIEKMPQLKFIVLTTIGSFLWNLLFITAGFWLGERWETVLQYSSIIEKVFFVVLLAVIIWWVTKRIINIRRKKREAILTNDEQADA